MIKRRKSEGQFKDDVKKNIVFFWYLYIIIAENKERKKRTK
jgi:hypothetical protein